MANKHKEMTKLLQKAQLQICRETIYRLSNRAGVKYISTLHELAEFAKQESNLTNFNDYFFPRQYYLYNFLRKIQLPGSDVACKSAALESFCKGEFRCAEMNRWFSDDSSWSCEEKTFFSRVRVKLLDLLGSANKFYSSDLSYALYSNGSTTQHSYKDVSGRPWVKENVVAYGTSEVLSLLSNVFPELADRLSGVYEHNYSKLAFVPKSSTTHRTINVENQLNMLMQKTVGNHIRKQLLLKHGINLNDQTINQRLALQGSRDKDLVTIDLENASNTISSGLVSYLLQGSPWLDILNDIRSKHVLIPNVVDPSAGAQPHELQMFSAMGNGFTFELESAIFLLIMKVATRGSRNRKVQSVYGDDIICHQDDFERVKMWLERAGFTVNTQKTFSGTHHWRESCGKHYCDGIDMTPGFMRSPWTSIMDAYAYANSIADVYEDTYKLKSLVWETLEKLGIPHFFGPYVNRTYDVQNNWFDIGDISKYKHSYVKDYQTVAIRGHAYMPRLVLHSQSKLSKKQQERFGITCDEVNTTSCYFYSLLQCGAGRQDLYEMPYDKILHKGERTELQRAVKSVCTIASERITLRDFYVTAETKFIVYDDYLASLYQRTSIDEA